jgi:hypothetical protein
MLWVPESHKYPSSAEFVSDWMGVDGGKGHRFFATNQNRYWSNYTNDVALLSFRIGLLVGLWSCYDLEKPAGAMMT